MLWTTQLGSHIEFHCKRSVDIFVIEFSLRYAFFFPCRSKKNKRSKSRERRHRRSRSRSRSRSSSTDRRRHRRDERHEREREAREKELEKERLREIALEFKQSGAFSSISQPSQSFQHQLQEPILPVLSSFPIFNPFSLSHTATSSFETPQSQPKEITNAYLEAVAASQRIAASKNFTEMFSCSNSNDSNSNNAFNIEGSNSSMYWFNSHIFGIFNKLIELTIVLGDAEINSRQRKKKSRWGGSENDKTFIPGMPTVLPSHLDSQQTDAYLGSYNTHVYCSFNSNYNLFYNIKHVKFFTNI